MSQDVVVAGAGAGGLACAHALSRLGLAVLVLDRRPEPATVPKGELLQPEAVRVLERWQVLPGVRAGGAVAVDRLVIRDPAGRSLLALDYAALPGAHRQILCTAYRTVLDALADALGPGVVVRRGAGVDGVLRDARGRVSGVRFTEGGRSHEAPAALVVAADGLSSRLRAESGLRADRRPYDHLLVAVDLAAPPESAEVCAYLTDRGLRLTYPLPGGRCRFYAQVRPDEFRGAGRSAMDGWVAGLLAELPALAALAEPLRAAATERQLLTVVRLRTPRLTVPGLVLVGEAAHAVHPMAAQGMNSSFTDAEELAGHLARRFAATGRRDQDAVDAALRDHQDSRRTRLDHVATVSHNAARMLTTTTGLPRGLGRRLMRNTAASPRLVRRTAGNLSGVDVRPLTALDRLCQLGLLPDRPAGTEGGAR
jgi:2-polyprenyl-6-methoxyphenol hydroxylase-like FAD-dependent oxidoreductase